MQNVQLLNKLYIMQYEYTLYTHSNLFNNYKGCIQGNVFQVKITTENKFCSLSLLLGFYIWDTIYIFRAEIIVVR